MTILPFHIVDCKVVLEGKAWGSSLGRIRASWYSLDNHGKFHTGVLLEGDISIDEYDIREWQNEHNIDLCYIDDYDTIYFARKEDRTMFLLQWT